jgi:hypothetical protein
MIHIRGVDFSGDSSARFQTDWTSGHILRIIQVLNIALFSNTLITVMMMMIIILIRTKIIIIIIIQLIFIDMLT